MAEGHSVAAAAGAIGVSRETIYAWARAHAEFLHILKTGRAQAALYWENEAKRIASGGQGSVSLVIFALKNRAPADWRDPDDPDAMDSLQNFGVGI